MSFVLEVTSQDLFPVCPPVLLWHVMHTAMYWNVPYLFCVLRIYCLCFILFWYEILFRE